MINLHKKIMTFLTVMSIGTMYGQTPTCQESQAQEYIENSAMKVLFRNGGDMFWDGVGNAQYSIPYDYGGPQVHALFAGAVWMGGYDSGNTLRLAAQTYRSQGNDYWAGPIDDALGVVGLNDCINFDQIWEVKGHSIEAHIADFDADGVINQTPDQTILRWPAKGNPHFSALMGFDLPHQDLAPFYDRNNNDVYEPMLGDYPVFKHGDPTAVAAEILWSVFNDNGGIHTQSGGTPLLAEIQQTAYVFDCPNDPILNHTLFVKHKVINKNVLPIYDFYYGAWSDPDLGCPNDDFIGSIPSKNTVYAYNQDNNDDSPCGTGGTMGYGQNPPVQALTFLNHPMESAMYHINNSSSPIGGVNATLAYYRLLQGLWPNGTPLTVGGDGYDPANLNGTVTTHMFPDHPLDLGGWSMASQGLSGLDQRWIASIKKDTFFAGQVLEVDMAYSYHRDMDSSNFQNVSVMYNGVDHIQQLYNNNFSTVNCPSQFTCTSNCIHPGDVNDNGIANDFDVLLMGLYQDDNLNTRANITDYWAPQTPPAPLSTGYFDANGDGTINTVDFDVNTTNFYKLHSNYTGTQEGYNTAGTDLTFERGYTFPWLNQDSLINPGQTFMLDISLGTAAEPINDLLGVTFRIDYDESIFSHEQLNTINQLGSQWAWIDDDNAGVYYRVMHEPGRIHYVATRLNKTGYSGYGELGRIQFRVNAATMVNLNNMQQDICFSDFQVIRPNGTHVPIGASCHTLQFDTTGLNVPIVKVEKEELAVRIYPNPAQTMVNIDLQDLEEASVGLYSLLGKEIYSVNAQRGLVAIDRNNLPSGMYVVVVKAADGRIANRKIIFE